MEKLKMNSGGGKEGSTSSLRREPSVMKDGDMAACLHAAPLLLFPGAAWDWSCPGHLKGQARNREAWTQKPWAGGNWVGGSVSPAAVLQGVSFHCLLVGLQIVRNKSHLQKKSTSFFSSFCSFDPHSHFTGKAHRDGYAHFVKES